jgi:uncharacterized protein YkwD
MPCSMLVGAILILQSLATAHAQPNAVEQCFPNTPAVVDCLTGRFAEFWQTNGGLPVFGFPTTPVYDAAAAEGTVMTQMVERNRLEYHPELEPPYDVLLGRLGADLLLARGRDWQHEPGGEPQGGCWFASETRHSVCDQQPGHGFLTFYRSYGLDLGDPGVSERESLALWGLPLSEPAMETNAAGDTVLTQWFERARFEFHPANPPQHQVLLGLLGSEAWGAQPRPTASQADIPPALREHTPAPADEPGTSTSPVPPEAARPVAPPPPAAATDDDARKQRLFELVEMHHRRAGCAPFNRDGRLDRAAQAHAADIAAHKRVDHYGTDGASLRTRLDRVGYPYLRASEGIGIYRSAEEVVGFWMSEPPNGPHRLNITNCQYIDIGVGLATDSRGLRWWVIDVANRRAGH